LTDLKEDAARMNSKETRREQRISIESVNLPLLGTRDEDHSPFQYLITDISSHGVGIAIPKWLVKRERLCEEEVINLHVPFRIQNNTYFQGRVVWTRWDEDLQAQRCGLHIEGRKANEQPVFIGLDTFRIGMDLCDCASIEHLLLKTIKDSVLLKKGVLIYLNHLIPYFSRISNYPSKSYSQLKELILEDLTKQVEDHRQKLQELQLEIETHADFQSDLAKYLELEPLREMMESEIHMGILETTFESNYAMQYLYAIKALEKKLYSNYNTLVLLYIQSLYQNI